MATVQTVVNRALRVAGVIGPNQTPTAEDSATALEAINDMLDTWRNDKLMVYSLDRIQVPLVGGQASYTIGPTGDVVTVAPVSVEQAFTRENDIDYPVTIVDAQRYNEFVSKTVSTNIPEYLYLNRTYPDSTITLYPVPSTSNTLHLDVWKPTEEFALSDTFAMPPGWKEAIVFNAALLISPEYGLPVSNIVISKAISSLASIKRINNQAPKIQRTQLAGMFGGNSSKFNINVG